MRLKRCLPLLVVLFVICLKTSPSLAQYYFGRNKIQYDDFQWNILRTEHFDVYFYPEMKELAEIGAAIAEEAYSRMEGLTNHNITERIPLIFYSNHSHFQQTNTTRSFLPANVGGFFEFIKGRVVIPSTGSIHDFKHVIVHEMVHVFTRNKMNRVIRDHRKSLFSGLPLWFTEGLADYWASGWDSEAEMIIRDAVFSGYLVPVSQMDRIYGTFLMYKEGQAICKFIAETFGEEKLNQLIENSWKEDSFSDVMKLTIGLNYQEFDEKWLYHLKKEKYPLMEENDDPNMITRRITETGINTKPAFFEKDGKKWVAFTSNRIGYSNIYAKPIEDFSLKQRPEILVKGERTSDFEAFYLLRSKIDVNKNQQLTFVTKSGPRDALYIFDIATKKVVRRFDFPQLVSLSSPNWSPNSTHIVFSGISFAGLRDLYCVELESGELLRLTNDFYDDRDPVWSPDGGYIAFSSDRSFYGRDGFRNLFAYNFTSGKIVHLTQGSHNDYSPVWSPDGNRIAFTSDRDGAFNIWIIENGSPASLTKENQFFVASLSNHNLENGTGENGLNESVPDIAAKDLPSGIEPSDRIKQITRFTTAAQDPEWIDDDRLLFTSFQNFSFQINELDSVSKKIENAQFVENDTLILAGEFWTARRLAGQVEATTIKYDKKFDLDIAQSAITHDPIFGTTGGAQLAVSDMLGNHQYYFLIYNNAQRRSEFLKSWNIAVTRVDLSKRVNYAIGGYRLSQLLYDRVDSFFEQERTGGFVSASYPFSVFHRIEGSFSLNHERREYDSRGETVNGMVVSNSLSYIKDNALWGVTGPIDGERYNLTLGHTIDVQHNDVSFFTVISDYRRYFRISRRSAYAVRLMGRFNLGKEAYRYFMGGSWDLRLYPRWRIWGRKLFLLNQELRFPFLDRLIVGFPFGGLGFGGFQGAAFVDLGQAWDGDFDLGNQTSSGNANFGNDLREVLGSIGIGIRMRLGGFLVLRYEIGRRFQIRDLNGPNLHWDSGLKKAFWFGFDF